MTLRKLVEHISEAQVHIVAGLKIIESGSTTVSAEDNGKTNNTVIVDEESSESRQSQTTPTPFAGSSTKEELKRASVPRQRPPNKAAQKPKKVQAQVQASDEDSAQRKSYNLRRRKKINYYEPPAPKL